MEQWPQIKEIFHAALEREPQERSAFLAAACRGDAVLRTEVERLLTAHMAAASFIEPPPRDDDGRTSGSGAQSSLSGRVVGRYEIGRLVGTGGMGEVYVARDVELGREVGSSSETAGAFARAESCTRTADRSCLNLQ